jgi:hypothetical protein
VCLKNLPTLRYKDDLPLRHRRLPCRACDSRRQTEEVTTTAASPFGSRPKRFLPSTGQQGSGMTKRNTHLQEENETAKPYRTATRHRFQNLLDFERARGYAVMQHFHQTCATFSQHARCDSLKRQLTAGVTRTGSPSSSVGEILPLPSASAMVHTCRKCTPR